MPGQSSQDGFSDLCRSAHSFYCTPIRHLLRTIQLYHQPQQQLHLMPCHKPAIAGNRIQIRSSVLQGLLRCCVFRSYRQAFHRSPGRLTCAGATTPTTAAAVAAPRQNPAHKPAQSQGICTVINKPTKLSLGVSLSGAATQGEGYTLPFGKCWLAGVGPGSLDHVTMKVVHLIAQADAIVYDDLGTKELLSAAAEACEKVYVGKRGGRPSMSQAEIDKLLVELCQQGKCVLRLKGGCPSTFSRVSSEAAALAAAGCPFELVPGVSTATAAAVLAGLPLTDSRLSGAYAVLTANDPDSVNWDAYRHIPTLVILMGARALPIIVHKLQGTGWRATTPVAVIKHAGTPHQQVWFSKLSDVENDSRAGIPLSPCVFIVGEVTALPATWQELRKG